MQRFEYKDINFDDEDFRNTIAQYCQKEEDLSAFFDGLFCYLEKLKLEDALKRGHQKISTQNYVGVIKYKWFQLDILPKLLKNENADNETVLANLVFMLSYTKQLDIHSTNMGKLSKSKNPFLEILIREYAQSLFDCLKRMTPRKYIQEEDNLNYLRGKLKFNENIRYNCANKAKFYCEYDEFSENNELNQLFLYVATCLYKISRDSKNRKLLKLIMDYFCEIKFVHFDRYKLQKIRLSKNQQLFTKPFNLAKMFVEHASVDISRNTISNITLLWDMNILFEEFIYEILNRSTEFRTYYQKGKRLLIETDSNKKYGNTFADMYVKYGDETIILDTKYKLNSGKNNDFDNDDVFQLMTYCLIHNSKKAVFIYPAEKDQDTTRYFLNTEEAEKNRVALCKYVDGDSEEAKEIYKNVNKVISIQVDLKQELDRKKVNDITEYLVKQIISDKKIKENTSVRI